MFQIYKNTLRRREDFQKLKYMINYHINRKEGKNICPFPMTNKSFISNSNILVNSYKNHVDNLIKKNNDDLNNFRSRYQNYIKNIDTLKEKNKKYFLIRNRNNAFPVLPHIKANKSYQNVFKIERIDEQIKKYDEKAESKK